jgi:GTP-binding protein HflX
MILMTDTVGFIQKLPTTLVAAFRATLEEIAEADMLLHVVDVSHPSAEAQAEAVNETLREIGAGQIPVLTALNKVDRMPSRELEPQAGIPISAKTGEGIPELIAAVGHELYEVMAPIRVELPYREARLISLFHEQGKVDAEVHSTGVVKIRGRLPRRLLWAFQDFREGVAEAHLG